MIEQTNENPQHSEGNANSKDQSMNQGSTIRASDESRNDERDQRIKEEKDTERLRSERQSVQDSKQE
jgi:hypothetical protein